MSTTVHAPVGWGFVPGAAIRVRVVNRPNAPQRHSYARHQRTEIVEWLREQDRLPALDEVMTRWRVSRATAYRCLAAHTRQQRTKA